MKIERKVQDELRCAKKTPLSMPRLSLEEGSVSNQPKTHLQYFLVSNAE